jgi:ribosomal protein S12 methylthiotransferase accessory factor YcaO
VRELVERDALMWRWVQGVSPARLLEDPLPEPMRARLAAVRAAGWDARLLDLTLDVLPVALCALRRPGRLALGMSCAADIVTAAARALEESAMFAFVGHPRAALADPAAVVTPMDHIALHQHPDHAPTHAFLLDPPASVDPRDVPVVAEPLAEVVGERVTGDVTVVAFDVPAVRPFLAVRAVAPGLVPIAFHHDREPLGHARLAAPVVALDGRRLGRSLDLREAGPIVPHPFP